MIELSDEEFIEQLKKIKETDHDKFMNIVLFSLKSHPEFAVEDDAETEDKVSALGKVLKHFEEKEDYEDCAFILALQKKIEDAEKR